MNQKANSKLLLVAGSPQTAASLANQLQEFLPEEVTITTYTLPPGNDAPVLTGKYFTLFSSEEIYLEFQELDLHFHVEDYLIGQRTIINQNLDKLLVLPRDQEILLVSDSKNSAMETLTHLKNVGFGFLQLIPYYPGCNVSFNHISLAITPGDSAYIPSGIDAVYNIGARPFDLTTVISIMARYDVLSHRLQPYVNRYENLLLDFAKRISNVADETSKIMKTVRRVLAGTGYYAKYHFSDIIGESPAISKTKNIAKKIGATNLSVLLEGENGTGKELFASAIHNVSSRASQPFVAINFSALPDQLIESELFGYEEGAFTGAKKGGKTGLFQQAAGGTIFLDEIGDISPVMQAKLLRVIQEKEIMKVGGDRIIPVDVRIIAATNRNLKQMIEEKTFRRDLYYRLCEGYIHLPSLDQRREDIPLMIRHWQRTFLGEGKTIDEQVIRTLREQSWPGNVRQLFNVIKFASAVCETERITLDDLPEDLLVPEKSNAPEGSSSASSFTDLAELKSEPFQLDGATDEDPFVVDKLSLDILLAIQDINLRNEIAGRSRILKQLREKELVVSEYRIRKVLARLVNQGFVKAENGKYGLSLTQKGEALLISHRRPQFNPN